jgi:hypothetical protein
MKFKSDLPYRGGGRSEDENNNCCREEYPSEKFTAGTSEQNNADRDMLSCCFCEV